MLRLATHSVWEGEAGGRAEQTDHKTGSRPRQRALHKREANAERGRARRARSPTEPVGDGNGSLLCILFIIYFLLNLDKRACASNLHL